MKEEAYFNRQIQQWGSEKQSSLQKRKIAIIGSGGLGCSLAMALGCSGIGEIHIVDFDRVSLHNIHRQVSFTLEDEESNKAKITAALIRKKNPFVKVHAFDMDFDAFSELGNSYDLILDATDNLPTREKIDSYAKEIKKPWIYASVEEFSGQVCFIEQSDFSVFKISDHKPGGIAAPMVMQIASFQANLALRYLLGLSIEKDKLHYIYFSESGEFIVQKINMPPSR